MHFHSQVTIVSAPFSLRLFFHQTWIHLFLVFSFLQSSLSLSLLFYSSMAHKTWNPIVPENAHPMHALSYKLTSYPITWSPMKTNKGHVYGDRSMGLWGPGGIGGSQSLPWNDKKEVVASCIENLTFLKGCKVQY